MDASQGLALVSSSVLAGASYTLPGPGGSKLVIKTTDARTAAGAPEGPIDDLVGVSISVSYSPGGGYTALA